MAREAHNPTLKKTSVHFCFLLALAYLSPFDPAGVHLIVHAILSRTASGIFSLVLQDLQESCICLQGLHSLK